MSRLLISLPYEASTNNYSKYFPFPLSLLKHKKENDVLIDINRECYKLKKEEKYNILDKYVDMVNSSEYDDYLFQVGDYAPDGDKYEYFEYFLDKIEKNVKLLGPYCVFKDRISKFKNVQVFEPYTNTYGVDIPDDMLKSYPEGDKTLRATMRLSNGCPRKCAMCPTPIIHNGRYKMMDIDTSIDIIKGYYERGVRLITFIDDNMGVVTKKFKIFLQKIKELNLRGMKFISLEGFETYMFEDEDICQLMKETRWLNIKTGMENINEDFLTKINKYYDDHQVIVRAMENIQKYKLDVDVYLLIGLDETEDVVWDNIRFIGKYRLGCRVNILRPYENGLLDFTQLERKMTDQKMRSLKSMAYAVSWLGTNHDIDMFEDTAFDKLLEKGKLQFKEDGNTFTFTGKVYIGFKTSKMIKVLGYLLEQKYGKIKKIKDDKTEIVFQKQVEPEKMDDLFD